jgi:predicted ATPase
LTRITAWCSPYHTNSSLYPGITHVPEALRFERNDAAEVKLAKLERALQRSANVEAIVHVQHGLDLLTILPDTLQRTQHDLDFLTTLGPALMTTKGYAAPEVGQVYTRARELC